MNEVLVVFFENLLETGLSFVVDGSKLIFFTGQILNSRIVFILERRESRIAFILGRMEYLPHESNAAVLRSEITLRRTRARGMGEWTGK